MTKEELDKEAEEFTDSKKSFWRQGRTCIDSVKQAYIAGAEPREKQVAELEESNNEWQRICEAKSDTNSQLTEQLADKVEKITELEKENAELKEKVSFLEDNLRVARKDRATSLRYLANEKYIEQLTKAKELLEDVYKIAMGDWNDAEWHDQVLRKAKQFLKESEE